MNNLTRCALPIFLLTIANAQSQQFHQQIDLAKLLAEGKLRMVNRDANKLADKPASVHLSERSGVGIAWIDGVDFSEGQIKVDIRGRDLDGRSFVGIAFHGKDDNTYEAVYLRPFNFRSPDPVHHRHAVQYMMPPEFDWPKLREQFPDEFERPVPPSISPTDWVTLSVAVHEGKVDIAVGDNPPALSARKLGNLNQGMIGLWTGNGSDGDFANLEITRAK